MSTMLSTRRPRSLSVIGETGIACICIALPLIGCDRQEADTPAANKPLQSEVTEPATHMPALIFSRELQSQFPEPSAFLGEFLQTCLAGDYAGYRRMVSRAFKPETRERFDAIYSAIESVTIESIELVDTERLSPLITRAIAAAPQTSTAPAKSPEVYRVVSTVTFDEAHRQRLREEQREIAILVFQETGKWRMAPAPASMQPRREPEPAATSAPATTSAPSYPWDSVGDD